MNSANALSFKGTILLKSDSKKLSLNTNYIKGIKAEDNGLSTKITYGDSLILTPFKVSIDTQTILNAYNATKNSNVFVDLTGVKTEK